MKPKHIKLDAARISSICLMLMLAGLTVSCTPRIAPPVTIEPVQIPANFPEPYYLQASASGSQVLRIDKKRSLVAITVRRGGALARLGHDHVVASHDAAGYVDITAGRADLFVPLDLLVVDEPALRTEAGLTTQPSADAIAGTRRNMLDKVLESGRYPYALIHINQTTSDRSTLSVTITLHNTLQNFEVPALFEMTADGLKISGQMTFKQSDFGITPFSILGGAMQVLDQLDLRFLIYASSK